VYRPLAPFFRKLGGWAQWCVLFLGPKKEAQVSEEDKKKKKRNAAVLSRYPGQRILVGDAIVVRIYKVEGKRVSVFIETSEDWEITRPSKEDDLADRQFGKEVHDGGSKKKL
jgi:hypothetical protein